VRGVFMHLLCAFFSLLIIWRMHLVLLHSIHLLCAFFSLQIIRCRDALFYFNSFFCVHLLYNKSLVVCLFWILSSLASEFFVLCEFDRTSVQPCHSGLPLGCIHSTALAQPSPHTLDKFTSTQPSPHTLFNVNSTTPAYTQQRQPNQARLQRQLNQAHTCLTTSTQSQKLNQSHPHNHTFSLALTRPHTFAHTHHKHSDHLTNVLTLTNQVHEFMYSCSLTRYTAEALRILEHHDPAKGPFFIYGAYQALHGPLEAPQEWVLRILFNRLSTKLQTNDWAHIIFHWTEISRFV
jgi:hypothetical protein